MSELPEASLAEQPGGLAVGDKLRILRRPDFPHIPWRRNDIVTITKLIDSSTGGKILCCDPGGWSVCDFDEGDVWERGLEEHK
jgi:hypothetical protein